MDPCQNVPVGSQLQSLCDCRKVLNANAKIYRDYIAQMKEYEEEEAVYNKYLSDQKDWDTLRKAEQAPYDDFRTKVSYCLVPFVSTNVLEACPKANSNYKYITDEKTNNTCYEVTCGWSDDYINREMAGWRAKNPQPESVIEPVRPGGLTGQDVSCCLQNFSQISSNNPAMFNRVIQNCTQALECCITNPETCVRDSQGHILSCGRASPSSPTTPSPSPYPSPSSEATFPPSAVSEIPNSTPTPTPKSSLLWLWITLGILGFFLIVWALS